MTHRDWWDSGFKETISVGTIDGEYDPKSHVSRSPGKAPALFINGRWTGFTKWREHVNTEADIAQWDKDGGNVGLRLGAAFMLDLDIYDEPRGNEIEQDALRMLGEAPMRVGKWPKRALLYRAEGVIKAQRMSFLGENGVVNIIEIPSQAIVQGRHPGTKQPYEWHRSPKPLDQLTGVTPEQLKDFMAVMKAKLPSSRFIEGTGAETKIDQRILVGDVDLVKSLIAKLPNTKEHFPLWEDMIRVGYAIRAALPNDPEVALELWHQFCEGWEGGDYDPETTDLRWLTLKGPYRIGAGFLCSIADKILGTDENKRPFTGAFHFNQTAIDPSVNDEGEPIEQPPDFLAVVISEGRPPLVAGRVSLSDLASLPPRQWMYGHKILRKYVTFIASPGGVGKTALTIAMALACASNRALLHDEPRSKKPLRVWLFNLEDDIIELRRRLAAALAHYGLGDETLEFIRLNSGRDRGVKIVKLGKDGAFIVQPDVDELIRIIREEGIDIAIFDPFLRTHGVPENENEAQDEVMRLFAHIAEQTNCGVVLVHHTKKGAIAGDLDSMRGGSTQGGGARAAFTLAPMSVEEAARLGIPEAERRLYVRLDDAKNNMAPPIAKAEWLKLESQRLHNVTEDYPMGDSVQVAAKWTPPDAWEGLLVGDTESTILAHLEAGPGDGERYSLRTQDGDRWAGTLLIDQFGRTPEQAKEVLASWQRQKLIEVRDYKSETQRKVRKGLFIVKPPADILSKTVPSSGVFD